MVKEKLPEGDWIIITVISLVAALVASVVIYDYYHPEKPNPHPGIGVHYVEGHVYLSQNSNSTLIHAEHCPCKGRTNP